jgi:hypothetical protein
MAVATTRFCFSKYLIARICRFLVRRNTAVMLARRGTLRYETAGNFKWNKKVIGDILIHIDAHAPMPFILVFCQIEDFQDILIPPFSKGGWHPSWDQLPVPQLA